jgi:hypothetical protein
MTAFVKKTLKKSYGAPVDCLKVKAQTATAAENARLAGFHHIHVTT